MVEIFKMKFPAFTGETERKIYVYTPKNYKKSNKSYPVMYMFDGHNAFSDKEATYGRSWRLSKYLDHHKIDLIVVGVDCHHGDNNERMVEYSPFDVSIPKYNIHFDGKGKETMNWFVDVLRPYINKHYRTLTDRDHTYLCGSSMGGIMTTYALMYYNQYFSKGCALSPAYHIYGPEVVDHFKNLKLCGSTSLYTDYGTKDLCTKTAIPRFIKINSALIKCGVNVTSRIVPDGTHCEACWEKQLPFAISLLIYSTE